MTTPKTGRTPQRKRPTGKRISTLATPRWATRDEQGRLQVNVAPAKAHLSELLERVAAGEAVVVARDGAAVALLGAVNDARRNRTWGLSAGRIRIAEDFNETPPGFEELV